MPDQSRRRSSSSPVLRILILVLIGILILSIQYPRKLWDEQRRNEELCRRRMENVNYAVMFYHSRTGGFTSDLSTLMDFARSETLTVNPPGFKMDRLTREDSGVDSFLVEYYDPYSYFSHYDRSIRIDFPVPGRRDTLVLAVQPLPEYPFAPVTRYAFRAEGEIHAAPVDRGDQGLFVAVGALQPLIGNQILGEPTQVHAADYIFNLHDQDLDRCPTCGVNYHLTVNVKLTYSGEVRGHLERGEPANSVASSPLIASEVVYRLLKDADARARRAVMDLRIPETVEDSLLRIAEKQFQDSVAALYRARGLDQLAAALYDSTLEGRPPLPDAEQVKLWDAFKDTCYTYLNALKEDSAFAAQREAIVAPRFRAYLESHFAERVKNLEKEASITLMETGTVTTTADSIQYYSAINLIRDRLFHTRSDTVTQEHLHRPEVRSLLSRISYTETYRVAKADSVGVTITCPIEGEYYPPARSLLDRIYSVGGEKNHGRIENNDLSWSEKR